MTIDPRRRRRWPLLALVLVLSLLAGLFVSGSGPPASVGAAVLSPSNPAPITINDAPLVPPFIGSASPYPSTIAVSGIAGTMTKVTVTLTGLSHTFPDDVGVLLVSPSGRKIRLMSDVGGGDAVNNVTLTFDDAAVLFLPDEAQITSGTYRPTQGTTTVAGHPAPVDWPAPAPTSPYSLLLSDMNGDSPNGTWSLYVIDDTSGDAGSIAGGWSLTITTNSAPVAAGESASTAQDTPVTVAVLSNDSDPDANIDPATVTVTSGPAHGSTSVNIATGQITYTPTAGFSGPDSFTYTVRDTLGALSNAATVSITVTPAPTSTPTSTSTPTPMATATGTATATPTPPSVTPTLSPTFCNPRPHVAVQVVRAGPGQLQATITSQILPATPANVLQRITTTRIDNAVVLLNGSPMAAGASIALPDGTTQLSLLIQRQNAGAATTVTFVVTDICGNWPSFVGGGSSAF